MRSMIFGFSDVTRRCCLKLWSSCRWSFPNHRWSVYAFAAYCGTPVRTPGEGRPGIHQGGSNERSRWQRRQDRKPEFHQVAHGTTCFPEFSLRAVASFKSYALVSDRDVFAQTRCNYIRLRTQKTIANMCNVWYNIASDEVRFRDLWWQPKPISDAYGRHVWKPEKNCFFQKRRIFECKSRLTVIGTISCVSTQGWWTPGGQAVDRHGQLVCTCLKTVHLLGTNSIAARRVILRKLKYTCTYDALAQLGPRKWNTACITSLCRRYFKRGNYEEEDHYTRVDDRIDRVNTASCWICRGRE